MPEFGLLKARPCLAAHPSIPDISGARDTCEVSYISSFRKIPQNIRLVHCLVQQHNRKFCAAHNQYTTPSDLGDHFCGCTEPYSIGKQLELQIRRLNETSNSVPNTDGNGERQCYNTLYQFPI